eukprot:scaffold64676_cov82-Phaeocystis_antarctica.AAC.3
MPAATAHSASSAPPRRASTRPAPLAQHGLARGRDACQGASSSLAAACRPSLKPQPQPTGSSPTARIATGGSSAGRPSVAKPPGSARPHPALTRPRPGLASASRRDSAPRGPEGAASTRWRRVQAPWPQRTQRTQAAVAQRRASGACAY